MNFEMWKPLQNPIIIAKPSKTTWNDATEINLIPILHKRPFRFK